MAEIVVYALSHCQDERTTGRIEHGKRLHDRSALYALDLFFSFPIAYKISASRNSSGAHVPFWRQRKNAGID
jgi:hypothetical protein